uniref:Integrase, catalytic region, zinc finger, CCHC-type, peptidase aspartic, catalytic n=1 Tax=Tanacetum cinerariifolium TaxID=118510 RepID=A0A6L2MQX3_TANCI|nr:hypothetical protein [Tanacetum cinerariifolium]
MESIHVNFDELPQMASAHNSSDPALTCQTMASVLIPHLNVVSKSSVVSAADAPNQRQQLTTPLNNHTTPAPTCQTPPITPTVISSENVTPPKWVAAEYGYPGRLLKRKEYFGQYGKVTKVSLSRTADGDSLNLPDYRYGIYTVKRYIADIAASFQRSQIHIIKLSKSNQDDSYSRRCHEIKISQLLNVKSRLIIKIAKHECLKPLQIKTIVHKKLSINQECQDIIPQRIKSSLLGGDQMLETSTLGEIVSLEKSNKNVNGLRILTSYQSMSV